jgi:hypothetical protein
MLGIYIDGGPTDPYGYAQANARLLTELHTVREQLEESRKETRYAEQDRDEWQDACMHDRKARLALASEVTSLEVDVYGLRKELERTQVALGEARRELAEAGSGPLLDAELKPLGTLLTHLEARELRANGLDRIVGGFARAEMHDYDSETVDIRVHAGVQSDVEDSSEVYYLTVGRSDLLSFGSGRISLHTLIGRVK